MNILKAIISSIFNSIFVDKESIEYKISCIKEDPPYIYGNSMFITKHSFIEKDIVEYNRVLEEYLSSDYINETLVVKKISNNTLHQLTFAEWFTDDKYVLDNIDILYTFLDNSIRFINTVEKMTSNASNYVPYDNGYMLQPYVTNIKMIIEEMQTVSKKI